MSTRIETAMINPDTTWWAMRSVEIPLTLVKMLIIEVTSVLAFI